MLMNRNAPESRPYLRRPFDLAASRTARHRSQSASDTGTATTVEAIDMALDILKRFKKSGIDDKQAPLGAELHHGPVSAAPRNGGAARRPVRHAWSFTGCRLPTSTTTAPRSPRRARIPCSPSLTRCIRRRRTSTFIVIGDAATIRESGSENTGPVTEALDRRAALPPIE